MDRCFGPDHGCLRLDGIVGDVGLQAVRMFQGDLGFDLPDGVSTVSQSRLLQLGELFLL